MSEKIPTLNDGRTRIYRGSWQPPACSECGREFQTWIERAMHMEFTWHNVPVKGMK